MVSVCGDRIGYHGYSVFCNLVLSCFYYDTCGIICQAAADVPLRIGQPETRRGLVGVQAGNQGRISIRFKIRHSPFFSERWNFELVPTVFPL